MKAIKKIFRIIICLSMIITVFSVIEIENVKAEENSKIIMVNGGSGIGKENLKEDYLSNQNSKTNTHINNSNVGYGYVGTTDNNIHNSSYYTFVRSTICKDVQSSSPYNPIQETDVFISSDSESVTWIHLTDIYKSVKIKWKWYDPNNNFYWSTTYTVPDPAWYGYSYWSSYKCWAGIWISGSSPEDMEGRWYCKVYIDESWGYVKKATKSFTIRYEIAENTMSKDVQTYSPFDPICPTTSFLNTDTKAVSWIKLNRVPESVNIKWDWYEPSGGKYTTGTYTTDDPVASGYNYWEWYKAWCRIDIKGSWPENTPGK